MDEMKLNLTPGFMRNLASKLIGKAVKKKLNCDVDVLIKEIHVTVANGKTQVHMDFDAEIKNEDITTLVKSFGLD